MGVLKLQSDEETFSMHMMEAANEGGNLVLITPWPDPVFIGLCYL